MSRLSYYKEDGLVKHRDAGVMWSDYMELRNKNDGEHPDAYKNSIKNVVNDVGVGDLIESFEDIKEYWSDPNKKEILRGALDGIRAWLNKFFKDSICTDVIYTNNTDKPFFGMCVMPKLGDTTNNILMNYNNISRIDNYKIEFDSKLFDSRLNLTGGEFIAIIMHEVGHMVNDNSNIMRLKKNMMKYITDKDVSFTVNDSPVMGILNFGIKDSLRKLDSIFDMKDDEIIADEFVIAYGFGSELESALDKIVRFSGKVNKDVTDKFWTLSWSLRLYQDIKNRRIPALYLLRKLREMVPSYLERKEIDTLEVNLRNITDSMIDAVNAKDLTQVQEGGIIRKLQYKGIRGYEDDLYELTMQARNVQREEEALMIMHRINSRMNVIDDYLNDGELKPNEIKRWGTLHARYQKLRDTLANKTLYKDDYSRICISYPEIKDYR